MKRTSPIWKISREELQKIVSEADSFSKILSHFNLLNKGNNHKTLKKRLDEDRIDYSFIKLGKHHNKGRKFPNKKITPISDYLTENSLAHRSPLKERLLKEGLLFNKCYICGQLPIWNNKVLSLQLDHINGISNDNRIENLRMLCPHCHSQTDNFAGKNKKK